MMTMRRRRLRFRSLLAILPMTKRSPTRLRKRLLTRVTTRISTRRRATKRFLRKEIVDVLPRLCAAGLDPDLVLEGAGVDLVRGAVAPARAIDAVALVLGVGAVVLALGELLVRARGHVAVVSRLALAPEAVATRIEMCHCRQIEIAIVTRPMLIPIVTAIAAPILTASLVAVENVSHAVDRAPAALLAAIVKLHQNRLAKVSPRIDVAHLAVNARMQERRPIVRYHPVLLEAQADRKKLPM